MINFLSETYWAGIGSIIAILSFVIAIIFYLIDQKQKRIERERAERERAEREREEKARRAAQEQLAKEQKAAREAALASENSFIAWAKRVLDKVILPIVTNIIAKYGWQILKSWLGGFF